MAIPLPESAEEVASLSAVSSSRVSTVPTVHQRNHGLTVRGLRFIYDQCFFCNSSVRNLPSFREYIEVSAHAETLDSNWTVLKNIDAVTCRESLNKAEWERNFFRKSQERFPSHTRQPSWGKVHDDDGDGSSCPERVVVQGKGNSKNESSSPRQDDFIFSKHNATQRYKIIPRNRSGQRIDIPVTFDKDLRAKMRDEQWCSNHHLRGLCPVEGCRFRHGFLDEASKNALLSLTRGNSCRNGNACEVEDCYAGHQCPYDPCRKGAACHFSRDMHITDRQIVNVTGPSSAQ